jgi:hypothetical protein
MIEQHSGVPHEKQGKKFILISVRKQFSSYRLNNFRFLYVKTLKTLVYAAPIENKQTVRQRICMRVKPVATVPGQPEGCDIP